jgi:hypothetical protein
MHRPALFGSQYYLWAVISSGSVRPNVRVAIYPAVSVLTSHLFSVASSVTWDTTGVFISRILLLSMAVWACQQPVDEDEQTRNLHKAAQNPVAGKERKLPRAL